jgi:hypothetical protein
VREKDFQSRVTDMCDWLGLRYYHTYDSRRSNPGFPDLVIVGPNHLIFVELKATKGRVSAAQQEWISALEAADQDAYVWYPEDWPVVQKTLTTLARPSVLTQN